MREFLLFCVLFCGIKVVSQNVNVAIHDYGIVTPANIVNINSKCYYVYRWQYNCCLDGITLNGINSGGQTVVSHAVYVTGWQFPRKLIKTADKCLLLLVSAWNSCDTGPPKGYIVKMDTTGVVLFQTSFSSPASTNMYNTLDVIQHPDSSYYVYSPSDVFHYSKTGQSLSYNGSSLSGIHSILPLSNGNLLVNAANTNKEITPSFSVVQQQSTGSAVIKFIQTPAGVLYGLTNAGALEKYSSTLTSLASSTVLTPSNFFIKDFVMRNDSVFAVGTNTSNNAPFYRLLDNNFNVLHQAQTTYKNVTPKGLVINNNKINVLTKGASATNSVMTFESVYQFPITGGFVSKSDIGVVKTSVNSYSYYTIAESPSTDGVFPTYALNVTVKNYGNDTIHSFYLNDFNYNYYPCYDVLHQLFTTTILPHDSVLVQTGNYRGASFGVPHNSTAGSFFYGKFCVFTTIPNASNDINIDNDAKCDSALVLPTGIEQNILSAVAISVYPNPFNNMLFVRTSVEMKIVELYNVIGILQKQELINKSETTIDTADLPAGIYFISIETEKGKVIKKVVKH